MSILIELSDDAASVIRRSPKEFARAFTEAAVSKWYELGLVSQGRGAEILGITRVAFLDVLNRHQVVVFQVTPEEVEEEFRRG